MGSRGTRSFVLIFAPLLLVGCGKSGVSATDSPASTVTPPPAVTTLFPQVTSVYPANSYTTTDTQLICQSACTVNYSASSDFLSDISVVCQGNLAVNQNVEAATMYCDDAMTVTRNP